MLHPDSSGPLVVVATQLSASGSSVLSFSVPASLPRLWLPLVTQVCFASGPICTIGETSYPLFLDARS